MPSESFVPGKNCPSRTTCEAFAYCQKFIALRGAIRDSDVAAIQTQVNVPCIYPEAEEMTNQASAILNGGASQKS